MIKIIKVKVLFASVLITFLSTFSYSQKHLELLKRQLPIKDELKDRVLQLQLFNCDSLPENFCSSRSFNHLTDKNKLTDKNGIGLKYLNNDALKDSIFFEGYLFGGLMKIVADSKISTIIDYRKGPQNRVQYDYDSNGDLINEVHYINGKEIISRFWEKGEIFCQNINPIINGTFESFCFDDNRFFTYYLIVETNDTSTLVKKYNFNKGEIESFKTSYRENYGCTEIFEINYFPDFSISRNEYILDCVFDVNSFEANYYPNQNILSKGRYIYPTADIKREKSKRTKVGEWKFYDSNNLVKKLVTYDKNGVEIDCKGECD
jgi:antitoxin component YwqK of YwqJK toxin-antitoxin module